MDKNQKDHNNSKPRWKESVDSLLVFYSLLAAVAGVLFALVLTNKEIGSHWILVDLPIAVSTFLLIYTTEKITDTVDENDEEKFLSMMMPHNIAVILLFFGFTSIFYFTYIFNLTVYDQILPGIVLLILFFVFSWRWLDHTCWLLRSSEKEYQEYIQELASPEVTPKYERQWAFSLFKWLRRRWAKKDTPINFEKLLIELKTSKIIGIGVFAAKDFSIGEFIAEGLHSNDYIDIITWNAVENIDDSIKAKINAFCIGTPQGFFPPENCDFNQLSVEWFMNHSCSGNVGFDDNGDFVAIKAIMTGDELAYDYGLAESNPNFSMECKCESNNCRKIITGNDFKNPEFRKEHLQNMLPKLRE